MVYIYKQVYSCDCVLTKYFYMADQGAPANGDPTINISQSKSMTGHSSNLTAQQEQAFSTFKENLIKANLYTPRSEDHEASHDDSTLLCAYPIHMCLESN